MAIFNTYMQFDYRKFVFLPPDSDAFYTDTVVTPSRIDWTDFFNTLVITSTVGDLSVGVGKWLGTASSMSLDIDGARAWNITGINFSLSTGYYDSGYTIDGFTLYGELAELAYACRGGDLMYGSTFSDRFAGFEGNDTLYGYAGNDRLEGWSGDDWLNGGLGNDVLDGGAGFDWADYRNATSAVTVNLTTGRSSGGDGIDTLRNMEAIRGSAFNDTLTGDTNNNNFRGGKGNDVIDGGDGFDWAGYSDATAAVTVNLATGKSSGADGVDTLRNIEAILGGNYNDTLTGSTGMNRLNGGLGNDKLTGGSGADSFLFDTAPNATSNLDTITDFNPVDDTVSLENGIFTALTTTGALNAANFRSGAGFITAADTNDYLIYNTTTGALYYDANGSATGAAIQIATFTTRPLLTVSDFWIT